MNTNLLKIKNGQELTTKEYLELVNNSVVAITHLMKDGHQEVSMRVTRFDEYEGEASLGQGFVGDAITFKMSDVNSVTPKLIAKAEDDSEDLNLNVTFTDGRKLHIYMLDVTHKNNNEIPEDCMIDVFELMEYLDEHVEDVLMAKIEDVAGFEFMASQPARVFVDDTDETNMHLSIGNIGASVKIPLYEDETCNEIYLIRGGVRHDKVVIKPWGQSLMEVTLLVQNNNAD